MDSYGYNAEWLAHVCGVDPSTARRWKRLRFIPERYRRLIELADGADLGTLAPAWRGWRIFGGELINPEGERFAVDQVRALRLHQQLAAELERQLRRVTESAGAVVIPRELVIRVTLNEATPGLIHARAAYLESPPAN